MSIKFLATISLLLTISSGYQTFLQDDNTPIVQAIVGAIPPTLGSYSNPQIYSSASQLIDLNYQLLTSAYQQVSAILNGIQSVAEAYSSGSMSDEDFANLLLSMIPQPFSSALSQTSAAQIYAGLADIYAVFVSTVSNLILQVDVLNQQFATGAITDDQYVSGLNQIYQNNGGILDFSYLYSLQKQFVTNSVNLGMGILNAIIPGF